MAQTPKEILARFCSLDEERVEANGMYNEGEYEKAKVVYQSIIGVITMYAFTRRDPKYEECAKAKQTLMIACLSNLAATNLKLGRYKDALENSTKVVNMADEGSSVSTKALYRRAKSFASTGDLKAAKKDLKRAASCDKAVSESMQRAVRRELVRVENRIKRQKEKELKMFTGAFQNAHRNENKGKRSHFLRSILFYIWEIILKLWRFLFPRSS